MKLFTPCRPACHGSAPALLAALACALAACTAQPDGGTAPASGAASDSANAAAATAQPASAASAPPVGVTTVRARQMDLPVQVTATGAVTPVSSVDVRAQTTSMVTKVHIREGQFVRAGEPLFTLDSRTDEANVARARAQLAKDEAGLADAQRQLARSKELLAQNFVSQGALDANQSQVESQTALLAADRAALDAARVALSNTRISAPGAGRAGTVAVFAGSSVQANQTTLVTITQLDPISVAFSLPQRHLADALAALQGSGATVTATLPEGGTTLSGQLKFVDSAVDPASGTVKVKAQFENKAAKLWPGAFVNVSLTVRTLKDAVLVPQASIIQSQRGTLVYVVQDGKAVAKPVKVVYAQGEEAAVTGLRGGEKIVLDGRQNLRPGSAVVERLREGGGKGGAASGASSGAASTASAPRSAGSGAKDGPAP